MKVVTPKHNMLDKNHKYTGEGVHGVHLDHQGLQCVSRCNEVRKICQNLIKSDNTILCTRIHDKCIPPCFFHVPKQDAIVPHDILTCTRVCVTKYDQCMFYLSKSDQGLCLKGRRGCDRKCSTGLFEKREGCSACEADYEKCILSVKGMSGIPKCFNQRHLCRAKQCTL